MDKLHIVEADGRRYLIRAEDAEEARAIVHEYTGVALSEVTHECRLEWWFDNEGSVILELAE